MTAFDRVQLARAVVYSVAALIATMAVVVLTDEPFSTTAWRVARLAAIAPAVAAVGVWSASARAASRGELRALEGLGVHPLRVRLGAILGGWSIGALAVCALLSPWSEVRALFPSITLGASWYPVRNALEAPSLGIAIDAAGHIAQLQSRAANALPSAGRVTALGVVLPLAFFAPAWAAVPLSSLARATGAALTATTTIVVFHALAVGRISPVAALCGGLPLALQTLHALRRSTQLS